MDLDEYYDPERFEEVAALHRNAFAWTPQNRIPLGVHVNNPEYTKDLSYGEWLNPEPFFDVQIKMLCDTLEVGSDLLPHVAINHVGDSVLTTMFGAELFIPEAGSATLQDVGPTPKAVFTSIDEVGQVELPPLDAGLMPEMLGIMRYYRERLPAWVHLVSPMPSGAFSTALELRGSEMLIEMVERPEPCRRLIDLCAQLQIDVEREFRGVSGEPEDVHVSNFGVLGAGLRIGDDSMVNLSPQMIRDFCTPTYRRTCDELPGRGHVHFCTLAHSRFDYVFPVFAESDDVAVTSTQFGVEYYAGHLDQLRGRVAVEAFYGDAYADVCDQHGSFAAWADDFVPRFKDQSGLVMYMAVPTVELGRRVYQTWQQAHHRQP